MWGGVLQKVVIPLVTSPFIGIFVALGLMKLVMNLVANWSPHKINKIFPKLHVISAAFVAFSHGTNDAQKTMGIITLALITAEQLPANADVPLWVKLVCAVTMMAGTSIGGWKIMRTMGRGVTHLDPPSGFIAETSSAVVIESMSALGAPISTTHVITSAVMGVGSARRISAVKWSKAQDIIITWVITLPATAFLGGLTTFIIKSLIS
jgi:PiT family inorganic phosphate transporter